MQTSSNNHPKEVAEVLKGGAYDESHIRLEQTEFTLLTRSNGIGRDRIENALRRTWPAFQELPKELIQQAWIIDVDAAIGGGPLGPFSVGVYSSEKISPEMQNAVFQATGWARRPTTRAYVDHYYSDFSDPIQAYVDDMVTHELGHLFFGFGLTTFSGFESLPEH